MDKECEICKSPIFKEQQRGPCNECGIRTCVYCNRVCDRCTKMVCWSHLNTEKVILRGQMQLMKLCKICKDSLKGYIASA